MNVTHTLGIDEVGRGCLAGPVTMTGVLLPSHYPYYTQEFSKFNYPKGFTSLQKAKDSKRLFPHQRVELVKNLDFFSDLVYLTISASNDLIDQFGIGVCLSHIVYILINHLSPKSLTIQIIVDGKLTLIQEPNPKLLTALLAENLIKLQSQMPLTNFLHILRENKADDRYLSVALASNIAKVHRDDYMTKLSLTYTDFGWHKNKGYGTEKHRNAIKQNLNNQYLRQSFLTNIKNEMSDKTSDLVIKKTI